MGEVEDTFYFGGWGGDRAYISRRLSDFVRSSFSKEYNEKESSQQCSLKQGQRNSDLQVSA